MSGLGSAEDQSFAANLLQFLTLQGYYGITNDAVEEKNKVWRIPELILPKPQTQRSDIPHTIEVDPAYTTNGS
jgi:hypothetical protein